MKKLLLILLCLPMIGFGQNVYIPDATFKAHLVGNTVINTNGDAEIQVSEATAFSSDISCSGMNISDLTGIEAFTTLTQLNCRVNQLTSLDVSNNTALIELGCHDNLLTILDIRNGININMSIETNNNPNLYCIDVDDAAWSTPNWTLANGNANIDPQHFFSNSCNGTGIEEHTSSKELLKITDLLGRETKQTNQPLFYIYDDGTVEKRITSN